MKPMDRRYIEQHDIAQRYLNGKLSSGEIEAFEVYLMDNPDALENLHLDTIFIEQKMAIQQGSKNAKTNKGSPWLTWWQKPLYASLATAAVCVLTFSMLTTFDEKAGLETVLVSPKLVYVSSMRGNRDVADAQIDLDNLSSPLMVVVQDTFEKDQIYKVDMFYGENDVIASNASYLANSDSELLITLPMSQQKNGILSIVYYSLNQQEDKRTLTVKINM